MKVRLVYETEIEETDCPTQFDILSMATRNMQQDMDLADSMDDFADVFSAMIVDNNNEHPSYNKNERTEDTSNSNQSQE